MPDKPALIRQGFFTAQPQQIFSRSAARFFCDSHRSCEAAQRENGRKNKYHKMHIEFMLPTGAGGQSALYFNTVLDQQLAEWSVRYHIEYRKTLTYYRAWIWLPRPEDYTVFALTWQWSTPRWQCRDQDDTGYSK